MGDLCTSCFLFFLALFFCSMVVWVLNGDGPDEYERGREAALNGLPKSANDNAYAIFHASWDSGWEKGCKELFAQNQAEINGRLQSVPKPIEKPFKFPVWPLFFIAIMIVLLYLQYKGIL